MSKLKEEVVNELHKPARRNFKRRSVVLKGIDDLWQADLIEFIPYARQNNGHKYLLTIIDCFSKFAWGIPIKSKSATDVMNGFKQVLGARIPKNLQTDHGKEFYNTNFRTLMKEYAINHYSTYSNMKASIVERFNRTLKNALWKKFSLQGSYKWMPIIQNQIAKYNNTKHRTIGMKPSKVRGKKIEAILLAQVYSGKRPIIKKLPKYQTGQYVRISKHKAQFAKGYQPSWSAEIFRIRKVKNTIPVTYHIDDCNGQPIAGGFYEEELQLVKHPNIYLVEKVLMKRGKKMLVKWLGFDSTHNSWI
jgi:hypothetical protein